MTFSFNQVVPFYLAEPGPFLLDRLQPSIQGCQCSSGVP
jgi:hypothetical protein